MTIFAKIIAGEIPCHRVYEDERVLAFLDIGPVSDGHLLVIPKEAKAQLDELSDESAAAHQAVMHVHFHIIPKLGSAGLGVGWNAGRLDAARAKDLVARMQAAL